MKILKIAGLIMGSLIGLLVIILAMISPKTHMERSVVINTRPEVVYNLINNYKHYEEWSPWAALDPDTKYAYEGPDSGPGGKMSWESKNEDVGSGKQWIIESKENSYVKNGLQFGGFDGIYTSEFILEPVNNGTKLTWTYDGDVSDTGMMNSAFGKFFGMFMDSMLGPSYENGLASLKNLAENMPLPSMEVPEKSIENDSIPGN